MKNRVKIVVCPKCGMHAHLLVDEKRQEEAISKECLLRQLFSFLHQGVINTIGASKLALEIANLPHMINTAKEAEATFAGKFLIRISSLENHHGAATLMIQQFRSI